MQTQTLRMDSVNKYYPFGRIKTSVMSVIRECLNSCQTLYAVKEVDLVEADLDVCQSRAF